MTARQRGGEVQGAVSQFFIKHKTWIDASGGGRAETASSRACATARHGAQHHERRPPRPAQQCARHEATSKVLGRESEKCQLDVDDLACMEGPCNYPESLPYMTLNPKPYSLEQDDPKAL